MREAHRRGLRVITELVINHTSDQHPWFQAARRAPPGSPERDYYVWSDDPNKYAGTRIIFTDTETSNWTWDPVAQAVLLAPLLQPPARPQLRQPARAARRCIHVMRFWLDMGVDGLRLDAIPYLVEREGTNCENLPETHAVLKQIRARASTRSYPNRMLLAEANQWPEDVRAVLRRRRRVPHGVPLPADAAHVHGDRAGGPPPDRRDHARRRPTSPTTASGRSSCATTTS